jgi:hypothetical protein
MHRRQMAAAGGVQVMFTGFRGVALAALLVFAFLLPGRAAHAVAISFTSTAEAPVSYFDGSGSNFDVRLDGKPSTTGGTCPLVCTADLTEGVQTSALTNVEMWSFGQSPTTTLSETHTLSYDLSITLGGTTVTETISHDMKVDFYPVNINGLELLGLQMLDGPATTFDFGFAGKIDVWVAASVFFHISPGLNKGMQIPTQMLLYDVDEVTAVPEPASAALLLSGIGLAAVLRRRAKRA